MEQKPPCECGHPYSEHEEIKNSKHVVQLVCMHTGSVVNRNTNSRMTSICACSNYKPVAETTNADLWR